MGRVRAPAPLGAGVGEHSVKRRGGPGGRLPDVRVLSHERSHLAEEVVVGLPLDDPPQGSLQAPRSGRRRRQRCASSIWFRCRAVDPISREHLPSGRELIVGHAAHGLPELTGFTDTFVMSTAFSIICLLSCSAGARHAPAGTDRAQADGPCSSPRVRSESSPGLELG